MGFATISNLRHTLTILSMAAPPRSRSQSQSRAAAAAAVAGRGSKLVLGRRSKQEVLHRSPFPLSRQPPNSNHLHLSPSHLPPFPLSRRPPNPNLTGSGSHKNRYLKRIIWGVRYKEERTDQKIQRVKGLNLLRTQSSPPPQRPPFLSLSFHLYPFPK